MYKSLLSLSVALALGACSQESSLASGDVASTGTSTTSSVPSVGGQPPQPGQLTAGEWRDLDDWDFWLGLTTDPQAPLFGLANQWGLTTEELMEVKIHDTNGKPLADAAVDLIDGTGRVLWSARSDVQGQAFLFPDMEGSWTEPLSLDIHSGTSLITAVQPALDGPTEVLIDGEAPDASLDLMFVVDTTGSMSDELSYLASELRDVITRVEGQAGQIDLRLASVFYRDRNDAYLVESVGFTRNVDVVIDDLKTRDAAGGGDWPEAVHEGLAMGIQQQAWSDDATSRLLFLILDAPPHEQNAQEIGQHIRDAASQGIRVIPVAASGIDKETETLLRRMDIATGATYTFLTNDSGIGNDHVEPTVGPYQVEFLNDLLVRLITESI